jgi:hypothetical protein
MADLSKLSDADLEAIASGRMQDVSTAGLKLLAGEKSVTQKAFSAVDQALGLEPSGRTRLLEEAMQVKPAGLTTTDTDIARQLGLTARAGVTGALSLPTLASDALVSLVNMMGGNLQMPSQAQQGLLTRAGVPEPATPQEQRAQDIASAIGGVLGGWWYW